MECGIGLKKWKVSYKRPRRVPVVFGSEFESLQKCSLSGTFSFSSSDSFDQNNCLTRFSLLGTALLVFGVTDSRASQVKEAEARLQAEALLGVGS